MMLFVAFIVLFLGFLMLALSMSRHYREVFQRPLPPRVGFWLRVMGWVGLGVALTAGVAHAGPALGLLLWLGLSSVGALVITLFFAYR